MLKDIIKKEILETITSPKFVFTFLLCAVLILLCVMASTRRYTWMLRSARMPMLAACSAIRCLSL